MKVKFIIIGLLFILISNIPLVSAEEFFHQDTTFNKDSTLISVSNNDGVTTDGTYIYTVTDATLSKYLLSNGALVTSSSNPNVIKCGVSRDYGGITYYDGYLYTTFGKYDSPYEAYVAKVNPATLTCVNLYDLTDELDYSIQAIFNYNGTFYISDDKTASAETRSIFKLNPDWSVNKVMYTSDQAGAGWQDATVVGNKIYVSDHFEDFPSIWVFGYNNVTDTMNHLYNIDSDEDVDYFEGITYWDGYFYVMSWQNIPRGIIKATENINSYSFTTRVPITVTTDGTSIPADYQINLNITYNSLMQSDFDDIRFANNSLDTELSYWIESKVDGSYADVWVNLSDAITDPGNDTIYMYYGNASSTSVSSGNDTFIQWHGAETSDFIDPLIVTPDDIIIEGKVRTVNSSHIVLFGIANDAEGTDDYMSIYSRSTDNLIKHQVKNEGVASVTEEAPSFTANTWYNIKQSYDGTTSIGYYNGNQIGTSVTTNIPDESMGLWIYSPTGTGEQEYSFVRKYIDSEPTYDISSAEQYNNTAPTTPTVISPLPNNSIVTNTTTVILNVTSTDAQTTPVIYYYGDSVDGSTYLGTTDPYSWLLPSNYVTYFWKARAYDGEEFGDYCAIQTFTILTEPNLTSPLNESIQYTTYPPIGENVAFVWEDLGAPQYKLQVAKDIGFNLLVVNTHISTATSTHSLNVNEEYWWRVYSYDGSTYSNASDIYSFDLVGNSSVTGSAVYGSINSENGLLSNAEVVLSNSSDGVLSTQLTGTNGYYEFTGLNPGIVYTLSVSRDLYLSTTANFNATSDPQVKDFYLLPDRTSEEWRHYVTFTVWGLSGYYSDVEVNVYEGDSVTALYTEATGSDGAVTFIMNRQSEYRVTFINATQGINKEMTLYPSDTKYLIFIASTSPWDEFETPLSTAIDASVSTEIINSTAAYVNLTWTDSLDQTTSATVYLNQTNSSDRFNQTVLDSESGLSGNFTSSFIVTNYTGESYYVHVIATHTTYGLIDKTFAVSFDDDLAFDGINDKFLLYLSIFIMLFTASMFGASNATQGSMVWLSEGWIFLSLGWFSSINSTIVGTGLAFATVFAIVAIISNKNKKEGIE